MRTRPDYYISIATLKVFESGFLDPKNVVILKDSSQCRVYMRSFVSFSENVQLLLSFGVSIRTTEFWITDILLNKTPDSPGCQENLYLIPTLKQDTPPDK
jgi:hypothetical protein